MVDQQPGLCQVLVEDSGRSTPMKSVTECSLLRVDQPAIDVSDLHDAVISHIYRAGLMIGTWCDGARTALPDEMGYITGELDAGDPSAPGCRIRKPGSAKGTG